MEILIYHCPEAPERSRYCAKFLKDGAVLPAVAYRPTAEAALSVAEQFLTGAVKSLREPKESPIPEQAAPKRRRTDLDDI